MTEHLALKHLQVKFLDFEHRRLLSVVRHHHEVLVRLLAFRQQVLLNIVKVARSERNLVLVYGLVLLVEEAYAVLLHQLLDRLLDLFVVQSQVYVLSVLLPDLLEQLLKQLQPDFLHDLDIGPLGHLGRDLDALLVVEVRVRSAAGLLEFVLGNLLVEHVIKEFRQVLVSEVVVEFTSEGLDDITATRGRAIS